MIKKPANTQHNEIPNEIYLLRSREGTKAFSKNGIKKLIQDIINKCDPREGYSREQVFDLVWNQLKKDGIFQIYEGYLIERITDLSRILLYKVLDKID